MKPGIFPDVDSAIYHADSLTETPSLSNGKLQTLIRKTPRHAWLEHPRLNPDFVPPETEAKFDIGTATHALLLEERNRIQLVNAPDWRTKEAKAARDAARSVGYIPMLAHQGAAVIAMRDAAMSFVSSMPDELSASFKRATPETSIYWKDSEHDGIWCRARADKLDLEGGIIWDYKTTAVESPDDFARQLMNGNDTQSVFYRRGVRAAADTDCRFIFLVQEVASPFMCYLVELGASMEVLAEHKVARGMRLWADCLKRDRWPGYSSTETFAAEAPAWAIAQEETQQ